MTACTTNCYDRIAHQVASIKNQHFGEKVEYLLVLFATTHSIKMFLRKSYGVSERFFTGSQHRPFQGSVQGNGAAPTIWLIMSIFLVRYSCDSKMMSVHKTPMSPAAYQIAIFLHVDDAALVALNDSK